MEEHDLVGETRRQVEIVDDAYNDQVLKFQQLAELVLDA
jgi:hypothetical protein